ncbi:Ribbon-helix-helix protein, CopG, partial [Klenkia terrae]
VTNPDSTVRRVPDMDLGAVFGNRTEGLTGLAPRRRRGPAVTPEPTSAPEKQPSSDAKPAVAPQQPAATTPVEAMPQADPAQDGSSGGEVTTTPSATRSRPRTSRTTTPAKATASPVPRLVILQLPNSTADRLRDNARQRGVTYKELALDAVEATAEQLPDLLAAQRPKARAEGMFAGERVATQVRPEGRRQVSIKLTETSIAALDDLATRHGARSRSELVATALDAYLAD